LSPKNKQLAADSVHVLASITTIILGGLILKESFARLQLLEQFKPFFEQITTLQGLQATTTEAVIATRYSLLSVVGSAVGIALVGFFGVAVLLTGIRAFEQYLQGKPIVQENLRRGFLLRCCIVLAWCIFLPLTTYLFALWFCVILMILGFAGSVLIAPTIIHNIEHNRPALELLKRHPIHFLLFASGTAVTTVAAALLFPLLFLPWPFMVIITLIELLIIAGGIYLHRRQEVFLHE